MSRRHSGGSESRAPAHVLSHSRIAAYYKEAGFWRAVLEDLLNDRPELADSLYSLTSPLLV